MRRVLRTLTRRPWSRLLAASVLACALAGQASAATTAGQATSEVPVVRLPAAPSTAERRAPRIVGGTTIPITQAPWQVYLRRETSTSYSWCGGSVLNATTILTAAHCVTGVSAGQPLGNGGMAVAAGTTSYDLTPPTRQDALVTGIHVHPYYDAVGPTATTGDLAVLTIAPALNLSTPEVRAIALPAPWTPTTSAPPVPQQLSVSGWGFTEDGGTVTDGLLRAVSSAPSDPDLCTSGFENAIAVCARSSLGSSCQGDSGGPLVSVGATPVLVGVVSNGPRCGAGTDDFYVSVIAPENRAFIDAVLANPAATPPNPPRAPRGLTQPSMEAPMTFRVGDTVSCNAGTFSGSPSEIRIEISKEDGTVLQSTTGPVAQMVIPGIAAGSRLTCRPYATNAGGTYVGVRFTTASAVNPGVASSGGPSSANASSGLASVCPSSLNQATEFAVKIKAPSSARRGQRITVRISRFAPPHGAHGVVVGVEGPKKLLVTGSAGFASTGKVSRENELEEYVKVSVRVPRGLKVGKRYVFRGTMLVANSVDEIGSERVCEYGSKAFKIKIKR